MWRTAVLLLVLWTAALGASAQTIHNDDTCDLAVAPAATLFVPYFEVDVTSPVHRARTTLITVTNVSPSPQIARVTLWSDWAYPVLTFNVFLTGYDMQSINLYDVLVQGLIATNTEAPGELSSRNDSNPNLSPSIAANCARAQAPSRLPEGTLQDVRAALMRGESAECGTSRIGGSNDRAIGYATIDVVTDCTSTFPDEASYFAAELLFDNVLIGDVIAVDPSSTAGNYANAEPMVHIRAIPEGGPAGATPGTALPLTFYDLHSRGGDRRQPLPSVFAARYIQGGTSGFLTNFLIWREPITGPNAVCSDYIANRGLEVAEYIRFDERENPTTNSPQVIITFTPSPVTTSAVVAMNTRNPQFPPLTSGDIAGWMYLNLDNAGPYNATRRPRRAQGWVGITMFAEGRYSAATRAVPLGNGCSPAVPHQTTIGGGANPIGPRP
jgi:hypothetical protein